MNLPIKDIIFNTEKSLHKKLEELYKHLVFNIQGDEILHNKIHVFEEKLDIYNFVDKVMMSYLTVELIARKELGLPLDGKDEPVELLQKIYETGISGIIFLKCTICKASIGARYKVDFVNGTMDIVYNEEYTNRHITTMKQFKDISIGTEDNPCRGIAGQTEFEFNFKCNSGKIVIANILDRNVPKFKELKQSFSINEKKGLIDMMRYWESHNFLYMQCGNSSPSILQNDSGEIIIGSYYDDEADNDYNERPDEYNDHIPRDNTYKEIGYVCTDLWAVHIIDYDDFKDFEEEYKSIADYNVVDISKLGTDIVVNYHYDYQSWDLDSSQILLTMKAK